MADENKMLAAPAAPITDMSTGVAKAKPRVAAKPVAVGAAAVTPEPAAVLAVAPSTPPVTRAAVDTAAAPELTPPAVAPATALETASTPKETSMNETITNTQNGAADAIKSGATAAYTNGKAALEQVTAKSKESIEAGMKHMDELSAMTKGNVEALLASAKAATAGLESIAHQVADFSRKSFEDTTAVARAMTTVKTPNEFMQLQNDFAKKQFDAAVAEMSKLSETLVKLVGEVFEPVQNRVAVATDKMKSAIGSSFNR